MPSIAVVAPLYYEAVHVLVKSELQIGSIEQLARRRVLLGSEKSGSRDIARLLLRHAGVAIDEIQIDNSDWHSLKDQPTADAAIVVTRKGAKDVIELLCAGKYRLMPIADSWQFAMDEPVFHALLLDPTAYPNCDLPESGIATVAITAYLAAKMETPPVLVRAVLQNLFDPEMVSRTEIFPASRAAQWAIHGWHPAAREFFQAYRGAPVPSHGTN